MTGFSQGFRDYQPSKTVLFWSCVGSIVAVLILGFTWGGWVTGGTAGDMAEEAAEGATEQLAAAICVDRFLQASDAGHQLASLKDIDSGWNQEKFIEKGGWAMIAEEEYGDAAQLCAERLVEKEMPLAQDTGNSDGGTVVQ